jgi:hypothetical protein
MKKHEYNADMDMTFSSVHDWHAEILLPVDARISEIHLRVYSFSFPELVYGIRWNMMKPQGNHLRIPIDAYKPGHSNADEAVHLAVDITYYTEID